MSNLVIFDCDGVLVDSERLANQALVDCLAELEINITVDEAIQRFKGRKTVDCLKEVERDANCVLPGTFESTFRQRMSEYFEAHLKPIPGAVSAVRLVNYRKCVASNGPLEKIRSNLEIAGFGDLFGGNLFSAHCIQKWKPDPGLFLHACNQMGFRPPQCLVVEDSDSGVRAARAGGFKVLAFNMQTHTDPEVISFQDMSELPTLINEIFERSHRR